ncbi:ClpP/crotonase, partial [Diplocarpon rosae]
MLKRALYGCAASCRTQTRTISSARMPLRAKIGNPAFTIGGRAQISTAPPQEKDYHRSNKVEEPVPEIKELEGDDPEDVLFNTLFGVRTIELNRPNTLNSLNGSMARKIVPRLLEWSKSDMANVVIMKGAGPKAFCAGGDVKHLAKDNTKGDRGKRRSEKYFALEYKLDHLIATYRKPYVAFMDGITMGGGVGLSIHAPLRIATERTVFAMPETTIGFFPDVGASFFLPRMPGAVGTYLALTSERLKGANVFYAGIATHYIHSTSLPALERRLAELRFKDYDTLLERLTLIDSTIEEFCTGLPYDEPMLIQGKLRNAIDRVFSKTNVPAVITALEAEAENGGFLENGDAAQDGELKEWAEKTLATLHQRSPTSVYVTLRQMQLGKSWSIREAFQREHAMASKFMDHPDFTEGVHALLIRKDGKPKWKHASLEEIRDSGENVSEPFFQMEGQTRLPLLSVTNYMDYPFRQFGIPTEGQVESVLRKMPGTRQAIVKEMLRERK